VNVRRAVAVFVSCSVIVSCLFPDLSALSRNASDGGDAGDGGTDASMPGMIANAGSVSAATGNAQQTHVIWAVNAKRWWLFYIDDDLMSLKTRSSSDFTTWEDGPTLALTFTNAREGRNFSVAYASLGGVDVVHISFSHVVDADAGPLVHTHTRAVISDGGITFGTPNETCSFDGADPTVPDGPATIIDANGYVWDATGFVASMGTNGMGAFNEDVFQSSSADDGQTWTNAFSQTTVEVVMTTVNARAFLSTDYLFAVWEGGDQDPDPTNLHFAQYSGSWQKPASVYDDDDEQDINDWDVAALTTTQGVEGHIVRALLAGGYEHAYGTGGSGMNGVAPANQPRTAGTGLVLLADPSHLAAFDITTSGAITTSRWNGTAWSAWTVVTSATSPTFLSGYCPNLDAHPGAGGCALIWTQPVTGGFAVAGQLVSLR
jgi:hypothetical protein